MNRLTREMCSLVGRAMYFTPGVIVDEQQTTTDLVDINLNMRILLGSSFYGGWEEKESKCRDKARSAQAAA
jgi:hydrogenase large subunit